MILSGPTDLVQTLYLEDCSTLVAVDIDETTGKIATASPTNVYVCRPYGKEEGLLKVTTLSPPASQCCILT